MLTDKQVKTAKGRPEAYKLADQAGLYLYVSPSGAKSWRYDYRVTGRRHTLTIGQYPLIPLKEARELHTDARRAVGKGVNPALAKRHEKRAAKLAAANSFRDTSPSDGLRLTPANGQKVGAPWPRRGWKMTSTR